jgi:hypothetical protein
VRGCGPNRHHVFMCLPPCKQLGDFIFFFFEYFLFCSITHRVKESHDVYIYIMYIMYEGIPYMMEGHGYTVDTMRCENSIFNVI